MSVNFSNVLLGIMTVTLLCILGIMIYGAMKIKKTTDDLSENITRTKNDVLRKVNVFEKMFKI